MTLYTRNVQDGTFAPLTRDQIRKIKRTDEVHALRRSAEKVKMTTLALASWLESVDRKSKKLDTFDLPVINTPNVARLRKLCADMERDIRGLK